MPIRVLGEEIAAKIAAGEVIERPASVVKELLENALDAGAKTISIETREAGKRLIEVSDDGCGIPYAELPLAIARFATSKLASAEDLFRIRTLGFRGEALASIAAVSKLTIFSAYAGESQGGKIVVYGGRIEAHEPVGLPPGTVVRVEDLFYNVPARLKFLKQESTERGLINALVTRYAMAYPQVRFRLAHDGRGFLQTYGHGDRREILAAYYGVEVARQMLEVDHEETDLRICGFVSPVSLTRSNRKDLTFFVNGRWVQDTALASALLQAYHTLLMVGRYPIAVLFIEMDVEAVDVNVHPAKAEVRFRQPERVFSAVQRAVRRALLTQASVVPLGLPAWQSSASGRTIDPSWHLAGDFRRQEPPVTPQSAAFPVQEEPLPEKAPDEQYVTVQQGSLSAGRLPLLRLVGQVGATYLVAEGPDGLYLIDQHAAHERVLFERFMHERERGMVKQALLTPLILEIPPAMVEPFKDQANLLKEWGFDIEPFGEATFLVRAIPTLLSGSDPAVALRSLIEGFEEDESPLEREVEARLIARICKRVAVKGGQILSRQEQEALLRDLEACEAPRTCPHGRPTMIHLSVDLLERQFGRRGSR